MNLFGLDLATRDSRLFRLLPTRERERETREEKEKEDFDFATREVEENEDQTAWIRLFSHYPSVLEVSRTS